MKTISLLGTASYMPENVVGNAFFGGGGDRPHPMFKGAATRHHVAEGELASQMITRASQKLESRLGLNFAQDVDVVLTNVSCLDMPFTGCGASVVQQLGLKPRFVLDVHNSGCVSFVYMMDVARSLIAAGGVETALICNVQNSGGRVFNHPENRKRPQSAVPGDGCGVGLVAASDSAPVRSIETRCFGEFADDMHVRSDDDQPWWAPRSTPLYIDFTEDRVASIVARGNRLVPEAVQAALRTAELTTKDVDLLITNQPNQIFLRNWREALMLPPEAHVNTYEAHGNLFGAAIPISFEKAWDEGTLKDDQHVALGGFSHAGDYSAAAIVHWNPAS